MATRAFIYYMLYNENVILELKYSRNKIHNGTVANHSPVIYIYIYMYKEYSGISVYSIVY